MPRGAFDDTKGAIALEQLGPSDASDMIQSLRHSSYLALGDPTIPVLTHNKAFLLLLFCCCLNIHLLGSTTCLMMLNNG